MKFSSGSETRFPRPHGSKVRLLAAALLIGASGVASAAVFSTGTGSTTSKFKEFSAGTDLVCDWAGVQIDAKAPQTTPVALPPELVIKDAVVPCKEVLTGTTTPVSPAKEGFFKLTQTGLSDCLTYNKSGAVETWTCTVQSEIDDVQPQTVARWRLTPDSQADFETFCPFLPQNLGLYGPFSPTVWGQYCYAELGVPDPADPAAFPLDTNVPFGAGVLFTFKAPSGKLEFRPCHSGTFNNSAVAEEGSPAPVLCSQTNPENPNEVIPTTTNGKADADLIVKIDISQGSLNMANKSSTAVVPVVFLGAPDLDMTSLATQITTNPNTAISMVGAGTPTPLTLKSYTFADVTGPDGVPDGFVDLDAKFLSGPVGAPNTFIYGVKNTLRECPLRQKTITVNFRGTLGNPVGDPDFVWIGSAGIVAFKCPGAVQ